MGRRSAGVAGLVCLLAVVASGCGAASGGERVTATATTPSTAAVEGDLVTVAEHHFTRDEWGSEGMLPAPEGVWLYQGHEVREFDAAGRVVEETELDSPVHEAAVMSDGGLLVTVEAGGEYSPRLELLRLSPHLEVVWSAHVADVGGSHDGDGFLAESRDRIWLSYRDTEGFQTYLAGFDLQTGRRTFFTELQSAGRARITQGPVAVWRDHLWLVTNRTLQERDARSGELLAEHDLDCDELEVSGDDRLYCLAFDAGGSTRLIDLEHPTGGTATPNMNVASDRTGVVLWTNSVHGEAAIVESWQGEPPHRAYRLTVEPIKPAADPDEDGPNRLVIGPDGYAWIYWETEAIQRVALPES